MPTPRIDPAARAQWDIKLEDDWVDRLVNGEMVRHNMKGIEIAPGIRARMNSNGISYVELHYSADPEKCTEEWLAREQAGNPSTNWDREYELAWRVQGGRAVYQGVFNPEVHIADDLHFDRKRRLVVAWDFGRDPCATFHQLTKDGRWNMLAECLAPERMPVEAFLPYYFSFLDDVFGKQERPPQHVADPSGWAGGLASEKGAVDVLRSAGIFPMPGEKEFSKRLESVTWWLNQSPGGRPRFQISRKMCPASVEGFISGYQYPRIKGSESYHHLPLKNEYSHPHDTIQYGAYAMFTQQRGEQIEREMKRTVERPRRQIFRKSFRR